MRRSELPRSRGQANASLIFVQYDMMSQITGSIEQWLQALFAIGIEDGEELSEIPKCLLLAHSTIDELEKSNCR